MKRLILTLIVAAFTLLLFSSTNSIKVNAAGENLVQNPSAETQDVNGDPVNWQTYTWGTNTSTFEYSNDAHTGSKSLHVSTTSYTSGDSEWLHDFVTVTPGETYTFSDFYKSSTDTILYLYYLVNGEKQYQFIANIPASADWVSTNYNFTAPSNTTQVTMMHLIAGVGDLWTDDYSIVQATLPGPNDNQILNPSVETSNGTNPAFWHTSNWGNNSTTFEYSNDAHTGSKSLHVSTTSYTDGDGKWYHDPVNVTPGETYNFSDFYKSTTSTILFLDYQLNDNSHQYVYLESLPANPDWLEVNYNFTVPNNVNQVTILHILNGVGDLWTDDFSILHVTLPTADENQVLNPSVEVPNGINPANWQTNTWGTNTHSFDYSNDAHTGTKSIHVSISSYTDGDAKWMHQPVNVTPGQIYKFNDFYKASRETLLFLEYAMNDGSFQYVYLSNPQASADWSQTNFNFLVPENVSTVRVLHILAGVGDLWTDDYSILHIAAPAPDENQILNPSAEAQDSSGNPIDWQTNTWGTNTPVFEYSNSPHTGSKSLHVSMTSYTDGDAKWYHSPAPVTPGETYRFSDYYRATTNTYVYIEFHMNDGSYQYTSLGMLTPSTDWTMTSYDFTAINNASTIRALHILPGLGDLWTDDYSLLHITPEPPPGPEDNQILNPSVENQNGISPAHWTSSSWGTNSAIFDYSNDAHSGNKSLHISMSSYTDGDAKWLHDAVSVTPGETYSFSNYYKSNTSTLIYLQYLMTDNSNQFIEIDSLSPSADWIESNFDYIVPENVSKVTVLHILNGVGDLWTDDYSILHKTVTPPDTGDNIVPNPSVETPNGNVPAFWQSSSYGNNTPDFQYLNEGQDGTRSIYINMTNYVSGDAKWFFDPVTVKSGSYYSYSNYYKSTVPTDTTVQLGHTDGSITYQWMGTNPASSDWIKSEYAFLVPSDVNNVTVLQFIGQNGELWTDNYDLFEIAPPTGSSTVPNGDLETEATSKRPLSWAPSSWGNNSAQFEYLKNQGQSGTHSVRLTVSNYVDGDAKWIHDPVVLTPGEDYLVTDYYKSDVDSRIVLEMNMQDNSIFYQELPEAPPAADWAHYAESFTMPANAVSVVIYHLLSQNGTLTTDNYDITPYTPVPFNRALLTLTFDDSWEDNVDTAIPMMDSYGFKADLFEATTFIQSNPDYTEQEAKDIIKSFEDDGYEIGSHSITHPDLRTLTPAEVETELVDSQTYLRSFLNGPINYFATPFGAYNQAVKDQIMQHYTVHRTVDAGFNSKDNFDVSRLKVQNILDNTTGEEVASWIAQAQREGTWLILVYHRVATDPDPYDTTPTLFTDHLNAMRDSGIPVVTISQALAELEPQL